MIGEIASEYHLWLLLLMQGTACIALGLAGSQLLRHRAARAHQVLLIALLAAVFMPAAYLGVRHFELGVLAAPVPGAPEPEMFLDAESVAATPVAEEVKPTMVTVTESAPTPSASVDAIEAAKLPWRKILLMCWAAAVLVLTARLAVRFALGAWLLHSARPLDAELIHRALGEACQRMGISRAVSIRVNNKVRSPVIWCWSRIPTLLVQTDASENTRRHDWVGVFCHELAHLKRRDHATGLFTELLICLLPWHPLLWWARKQLLRFSEEACDDWVLAGGRDGVDYAESLLELSPQPALALVPTVVGKEKTMKARIRRIVEEKCGVPHIGRRWATVVTLLVLTLTLGVAFAQRRPADRPRPERAEQRELMMAGRRNVLNRLLEQLVEQTHEIEAALRERGDNPGPDGTVMRAELDALHEQIGIIERQLGALERRERPRPGADERNAEEEAMSLEEHLQRVTEVRGEAVERVRHLEVELEALGDRQPETRERLENQLRQERRRSEVLTREQERLERQVQIEHWPREEQVEEIEVHTRELNRRQDELAEQAGQLEVELRELPEGPSEPRLHVEQELQRVHKRLEAIQQERAGEVRQRAEDAARDRAENQRRRDLTQHLGELQRHTRETERNLDRIDDKDSTEAQELRANLDASHEEMAQTEQELSRLGTAVVRAEAARDEAARAEAQRPTRSAVTQTVSGSRQARTQAPRREGNLRQAQERLRAQIRETEEQLRVAREQDDPAAERFQRQLGQLQERRKSLERAADALNDAPRERPARNPDVQRQVEELRGQMNGMHQEMAQMRAMLQQLLERRRVERQEEAIEESSPY